MKALPATLLSACEAKIQAEKKPLADALARLRAALNSYEGAFDQDAERRVVGAMLAALGQDAPEPTPGLEKARTELRLALEAVSKHVVHAELARIAEQPSPPPKEPDPFVPAADAPPPASAEALAVDVEAARALLDEINDYKPQDDSEMRFVQVLRAFAAESRMYMVRIPSNHPIHWQLSQTIRYLSKLNFEHNLQKVYVRGLGRTQHDDWERLSREARGWLAKFDQDAEAPAPSQAPKSRPSAPGKKDDSKNAHSWPALRALRARLAGGKEVLFVGGWRCDDKVRLVKERFGLEVEWYETDPQKPRFADSAVSKVKGGRVAAVVLLEGFITHKDANRIVDAAAAVGVPLAMANRAGVASLETAFNEIERKLVATGT